MLSKEKLLNVFTDEDIIDATKIYEKYKLAYEKDITVFSNGFYPPNIWSYFEKNLNSNIFLVESNGLFQEAERRMISFNNNYGMDFPIDIIKVMNKSNFSNLKHKDFLGGILSLGIERNKIGDIVVKDNTAYLPVINDISNYILSNLSYIGKSPVEVTILNTLDEMPQVDFEEMVINVSSLRIDSIVAKLCNLSRSKAIEELDSGKVLIDYVKAKDKSQEIIKGSRLTIRGSGKYLVGDIVGETRSGKQKVRIKKYI
ncbi:RNA-binding protein [Clostridium tertium]|uniref:RNA-binding S4 domain-containing protein n=1 Tax=Clostridium tertium TaxID=1559 RepID=A0A6N3GF55_9CLOT